MSASFASGKNTDVFAKLDQRPLGWKHLPHRAPIAESTIAGSSNSYDGRFPL